MFRRSVFVAAALTAAAFPVAGAQAALGADAGYCAAGKPSILVNISGFKNRAGSLRVQLYGSNPADFLAKGKKLRRVDVPVNGAASMPICIAVPRPGTYAVSVHHDADANGKRGWSDGGGFSNNPKLSMLDLKPTLDEVAVRVGNGVRVINVVLNYRRGLTIGPIG